MPATTAEDLDRLFAEALNRGDLALVYGDWHLEATTPEGQPVTLAGRSVEVHRRQPDGTWRMIIDEPMGVQA